MTNNTESKQLNMGNHTRECLRDGDESSCPVCVPINEKFKKAGLRKSKVWTKGENIELYQSMECPCMKWMPA